MINNLLNKTIFIHELFKRIIKNVIFKIKIKIPDSEETLILIHIGKCAGTTLDNVIKNNKAKLNYKNYFKIHLQKPPILKKAKYIIVIRNPIERIVSAFYWRSKIILLDKQQQNRFYNEKNILENLTLIEILNNLYKSNKKNKVFHRKLERIHHIKEGYYYYLNNLLKKINKEQILYVFTQENLTYELNSQLGIKVLGRLHENKKNKNNEISKQALHNLKKFLKNDYDALKKLNKIHPLTNRQYNDIFR